MMEDYVSSRKPFGIEGNFVKTKDFHKNKKNCKKAILCYGKNKIKGYVERNIISHNINMINKWKVYVPRANNIGTELSDDNLNAFVGNPNSVCTESYLFVSNDFGQCEAENLVKYLKTRFSRFMHSLAKASQDATSKTYQFVPMQNFTNNSDIKWNKSISEIDKQLYKKYGLSPDEIEFIEQKIKPME